MADAGQQWSHSIGCNAQAASNFTVRQAVPVEHAESALAALRQTLHQRFDFVVVFDRRFCTLCHVAVGFHMPQCFRVTLLL